MDLELGLEICIINRQPSDSDEVISLADKEFLMRTCCFQIIPGQEQYNAVFNLIAISSVIKTISKSIF